MSNFLKMNIVAGLCLAGIICSIETGMAHDKNGFDNRETVCLKSYPTDPSLFNETVRPFVSQIIKTHGLEEWKATLLTNEMHRHLGLWSIIGAKMGVRAREVLNAPFDHLSVISLAGNNPPFSCLNDGIQVSTGSSLGRGTISNTHLGRPEAIFIYNGKKLSMTPKPAIRAKVRETIKDLSKKYGFQSHPYFKELEKVSVNYWLDWQRKDMFTETIFE